MDQTQTTLLSFPSNSRPESTITNYNIKLNSELKQNSNNN